MLRIEHQPAVEPVTLAEVKSVLRLTQDADDVLLSGYITAAREMGEKISGLSLVYKGYAETFECFPRFQRKIKLQGAPLISVTSVEYVDPNYDTQEWDASEYRVMRYNVPGVIQLKHPNVYPITADHTEDAVTVTSTPGTSTAATGTPRSRYRRFCASQFRSSPRITTITRRALARKRRTRTCKAT
jgi:uncharacterized phiE125 gp8 family phage protein